MIGRQISASVAIALVAALAVASIATMASGAPRSTTDRLDAERERLRQIEADLLRLDGDARAAAAAQDLAQDRLIAIRREIVRTKADIVAARAARIDAQARLTRRLLDVYASEPPGLFELVLTADSVTTAIDSYEFVERAAELDQRVLTSLTETSRDLAGARARLGESEAAETTNLERARGRAGELAALVDDRQEVLGAARSSLDALLSEAQQAALAADQARRAADAARRVAAPATEVETSVVASAPAAGDAEIMAHLARIAQCESGGNPQAVSRDGLYRGKYQFHPETWRGLGGSGDPAAAVESEQDARALMLYRTQGPGAWPVCSQV